MNSDDTLSTLLHDTHELEAFFHGFISHLAKRHLKSGVDFTRYASEFGLKIASTLKGAKIAWAGGNTLDAKPEEAREQTLVFARPGVATALGFTIGCIHVGRASRSALSADGYFAASSSMEFFRRFQVHGCHVKHSTNPICAFIRRAEIAQANGATIHHLNQNGRVILSRAAESGVRDNSNCNGGIANRRFQNGFGSGDRKTVSRHA